MVERKLPGIHREEGIHAIVHPPDEMDPKGVQVDATEDSFHYCPSIGVLRQSLITPEEMTMTEVILKVPPGSVDATRLPPDDIHAGLLKGTGTSL